MPHKSIKIKRICEWCHIEYFIQPWKEIKGDSKYCSRKCYVNHKGGSLEERFKRVKYIKTESECIIREGSNGDYGSIRSGNRVIGTHQASWEIHNGPIPEGMCVLHSCDNPPCVNPEHLFLGTQLENIADMNKKGRHANFNGEKGGQSKVSNDQAKLIRKRYSEGNTTLKELAIEHNVSISCISLIVNNKTYKDK